MNLTVVGPRVFIRPEKLPEQTETGLFMVHDRQASTMRGVVVALGDGPVTKNGVALDHFVAVGDAVLFSPNAGEEVIFDKDVLICIEEDEILAVID